MPSSVLTGVRSFGKVIVPSCLVLLAHIVRVFVFPLAYEWDELMHFLGGASIAWIAWSSIIALQQKNRLPALPTWFQGIVSISFAGLVGLLWELYEYATFIWWIPSMNILLPDTEQDMFLDVCGAVLVITGLILHRRFFQKERRVDALTSVFAQSE